SGVSPSDSGAQGFALLSRGSQAPQGQRSAGEEAAPAWVPPGEQLVAMEEVMGWLKKASNTSEELPFTTNSVAALLNNEVGSAEIPFTHAFRHLKLASSFPDAMRAVLAGGGDSCSSAAVVGGLLGAAAGIQGLPERWVRAVLGCDGSAGQWRPPEYHTERLPKLLERICAPRN
ncbi:unnamed protein product, partial [Polarella glacialis]